jgi:hypothetical protein
MVVHSWPPSLSPRTKPPAVEAAADMIQTWDVRVPHPRSASHLEIDNLVQCSSLMTSSSALGDRQQALLHLTTVFILAIDMSHIPTSQYGTQNFQPQSSLMPLPSTTTVKKHKYICAGTLWFPYVPFIGTAKLQIDHLDGIYDVQNATLTMRSRPENPFDVEIVGTESFTSQGRRRVSRLQHG